MLDYNVYKTQTDDFEWIATVNVTNYTVVEGLEAGENYTFAVEANNLLFSSIKSDNISI